MPPDRQTAASRQPDTSADRIGVVEIRARVRLIDDGDPRRAAPIGRFEQAAHDGTNVERREILRRDLVAVGELVVDGRIAADHRVGGESHGEQALMQRRSGRRARGHDAGQRLDAIDQLLVETRHPQLARALVADDDAAFLIDLDVADVDAPRDVEHQSQQPVADRSPDRRRRAASSCAPTVRHRSRAPPPTRSRRSPGHRRLGSGPAQPPRICRRC